ncbi:2-oxo-4-hydroxy-4-carboxy-5-ureidoimidazoline decarboxylase [Coraliomargarita parva]|uniref:2-oxo-4-hydroxy-4-carboxy-5-ureidoimidazoline decarboxylase n=1 Tax=Coraliomargarita parva TaxID=3014050 RepID=UPI0022B583A5|nr:2-oxo-4-hydroxy-4-carboxy-5-ureidoimidazoline decarboxylase [Coraliomargarita parva]
MDLKTLNGLSREAFSEALGQVFEHSPWVVELAAGQRPFSHVKALQAACESALYGASPEQQVALIQAHPDLAAKLDQLPKLTDFSQAEQKRAGFAALPEATLAQMREVLAAYRERFGHPFILCVTEHPAADVLPMLEVRCQASPEAERMACLFQIARIGWHRICSLVDTPQES